MLDLKIGNDSAGSGRIRCDRLKISPTNSIKLKIKLVDNRLVEQANWLCSTNGHRSKLFSSDRIKNGISFLSTWKLQIELWTRIQLMRTETQRQPNICELTDKPFLLRTLSMYFLARFAESAFSPKCRYSSSVVGIQNGSMSMIYGKREESFSFEF